MKWDHIWLTRFCKLRYMFNDFALVRVYYPICTIKIEISIISTFVGRHLRGYWKYNWLTYTSSFYLIIFISHVNPWARITTSVSINRVNIFPAGPQDNAERGLVFEHYEFNTRALVFSRVTAYDSNISYSRWHDIRWKVIIN